MAPSGAKPKRNVRIDSLPSDRRIAAKDCRQCVTRRIKCDRSMPHCRKCSIRGLVCPGFPRVYLRWDQGVASRGYLSGKSLPLVGCNASVPGLEYVSSSDSSFILSPQNVSIQNASPTSDAELATQHLSRSLCDKLLLHFLSNVASRLTWIDGPDNPWRSLVLPLAQRSACLRLSILGLAAAHLSATSAEFERSSTHLQVNQRLRNEILGTLSRKMQIECSANSISVGGGFLDFSLVEMLASMLVLCYGELHIPGSMDWKLHLRACHAIIERHHLRSMRELSGDVIAKWLINEVIDLEIFGNISAFTLELDPSVMMTWPAVFDGDFWDFTLLINETTVAERSHYALLKSSNGPVQVDMRYWHAKLEIACTRASMLISSFPEDEPLKRTRFRAIIEAHYHACLIYSYQALASQAEAAEAIQSSLNHLWNIVVAVTTEPGPTFAHDIFFPLFIVGTESQHDKQRQSHIENLFLQSIATTGFWCNHAALQFLHLFWESSSDKHQRSWIQFARINEEEIGSFFVF
ncbi:uncharacterized protein N7443_008944 [Penicillium atrosanguineum]|uniref:uncharacterized protein n=1 Tax=Penicillium atrosanguineum TaxID=1132637 RepID=UPI0023A0A63E|nr:uncharacterized protein N7443_008944 [Penicillium atrosanguineum]KAJ5292991.1 hypothetical protein N7443_008944 [Penicillium atrosanguineum]